MIAWDAQRDPRFWSDRRGRVNTRTGMILEGRVDFLFMGYYQFGDLAARATYGQLLFLGVTGRMPTAAEERMLDAMTGGTSYGDPRLWFLSAARWGGEVRSPAAAALAGAVTICDSKVFGGLATYLASDYFQRSVQRIRDEGIGVEALVAERLDKKETIPGYGRPLVRRDERVPVLLKIHSELGFPIGPHLRLALDIQEVILRRKDIVLNTGGVESAIMSDMGLTPRQINSLVLMQLVPSIFAAMMEGYDEEPGEFLPQACEDIEYTGPAERAVPSRD
ncbi:MAG: hypothetical protein HY303_02095 [Candidatus Wallbacteria bacterium]|nr:hypothetical protein [Candidatus Wallbacteria bacterium]